MFGRFKNSLSRFMYGRYGGDTLNFFLLIVGLILSLISYAFYPLTFVSLVFYIYALFRSLSRNISARQREQVAFIKFIAPFKKWFTLTKRKFADRKLYKYFKCPECKQQLRAPKGRGKIAVTCQKCHKQFNTKT